MKQLPVVKILVLERVFAVIGFSDRPDFYAVYAAMERQFAAEVTGYAIIADISGRFDNLRSKRYIFGWFDDCRYKSIVFGRYDKYLWKV